MLQDIEGSPYYWPAEGVEGALSALNRLSERVELLRSRGTLTPATLTEYYTRTRFEQIAESNALEGSTLSVGETELAVMKGITITGHDPGFVRDARTLSNALDELAHMARIQTPTDLRQLRQLHESILGERSGAGVFRTGPVTIRGSEHRPPRDWRGVMDGMEGWSAWSKENADAHPVLRAAVLHAWLEHIHPFIDGNGRTGRAITTLELVRRGYPPIIIRRKDRSRYLEALRQADSGDLGPFVDLVLGRTEDALRDLEKAAGKAEGYDIFAAKNRRAQEQRLAAWNARVKVLIVDLRARLSECLGDESGRLEIREYDELSVEDFIALCENFTIRNSWVIKMRCVVPGMPPLEYLAWAGLPGTALRARLAKEPGRPVLIWSVPNPERFPPWKIAGPGEAPAGEQMTILGDRWLVAAGDRVEEFAPDELARRIAADIAARTIPPPTL